MPKISQLADATLIELGPKYDALDAASLIGIRDLLLEQAKQADPPILIVDMSHTRYFGSAFLELLLRVWKRLREREGRMLLCGLTPFCGEVIQTTRLDSIWECFATRDEALGAMRGQ